MSVTAGLSLAEQLALMPRERRGALLDAWGAGTKRGMQHAWHWWERPAQTPPVGDWRIWLVLAGRGFGKTRMGAEWVRALAEGSRSARIALVAATIAEGRAVMIEGESGLLSVCPPDRRPRWEPSLNRLSWPGGAKAFLYSAAEPDMLRGPQHHHGWCDEVAKWPRAEEAWDNLALGLRLGRRPRTLATTTPRPMALLRGLIARDDVALTRGRTADNVAHLATEFVEGVRATYGGTRLGRQELDGELIEEIDGALWSRALIERCRGAAPAARRRVVVGVDPPAGTTGDACGIVAVTLGVDGRAYVLEDASVERCGPEQWARAVAACARRHEADRVVAEANNGGAMVESVLRAADAGLPVVLVHASHGKAARAEPVMLLYERGQVAHVGAFPRLEDEMCGLVMGGAYQGPGRSPDRADALVWAVTSLMLGKRAGEPGLRIM